MSRQTKNVLFIIDILEDSIAERSLVEIAANFGVYTPAFVQLYKGDMLMSVHEKERVKVYSFEIQNRYGFKMASKSLISNFEEDEPHYKELYNEVLSNKSWIK